MGKEIHLKSAMKNRDDEFYTRYFDIESEISHYFDFLKGKIIYCNCDDPCLSNFPRYFIRNFHKIGLKRLICTGYNKLSTGYFLDVCKDDIPLDVDGISENNLLALINAKTSNLIDNGDFSSYECISYLKECDVVVTNPPFSKFRDFFKLLIKYNKDMILLAPLLALGYKIVLPYISTGYLKVSSYPETISIFFFQPDHTEKKFRTVRWITTFEILQNTVMNLCEYNPNYYNFYDEYPNYINVDSLDKIPDYDGVMGVPVTYLENHNPLLFEIVDFGQKNLHINGKSVFTRLLIRRRGAGVNNGTPPSSENNVINWEDYQINDLNTDIQTNISNWV